MKHILLVEDEQDDAFFFLQAVKKTGSKVHVTIVDDGQAAIDYLAGRNHFADRTSHPLPQMVILDLHLPRVNGMDVLKWIREQSHLFLVVIILSSSESDKDLSRAYELGANSYVVKPIDTSDLIRFVQALDGFWTKYNRLPSAS